MLHAPACLILYVATHIIFGEDPHIMKLIVHSRCVTVRSLYLHSPIRLHGRDNFTFMRQQTYVPHYMASHPRIANSACLLISRRFLAWLILRPWRWRWYVPPKRLLTSIGLHGVISQRTELFMNAAVRTANRTRLEYVRSSSDSFNGSVGMVLQIRPLCHAYSLFSNNASIRRCVVVCVGDSIVK
jgi:hypothetical protein